MIDATRALESASRSESLWSVPLASTIAWTVSLHYGYEVYWDPMSSESWITVADEAARSALLLSTQVPLAFAHGRVPRLPFPVAQVEVPNLDSPVLTAEEVSLETVFPRISERLRCAEFSVQDLVYFTR